MDILLTNLTAAGLVENGCIVLERYPDGGCQAVDVETFRTMFGETIETASPEDYHAALTAADASRGYARFFDAWHTTGIL